MFRFIGDAEDTIVLDDQDWNICPSEAPIAGRDFRLTKGQGCFNGREITETKNLRVFTVYESRNVSIDCSITDTLVYNSFGMDWIIAPSFPRFNRSLLVSRTAYTKGKLFAVGNGSCWTLVKVYGMIKYGPLSFRLQL